MYKIYINETPLFLLDAAKFDKSQWDDKKNMLAPYPGKPKLLMAYIDMLEKSTRFDAVVLYAKDYQGLKRDFENHFTIIEAAGGLVLNPFNEILFIFRKGYWDLPKGKIDKGESIEDAAIREVMEETGLNKVRILSPLPVTHHTYRLKKGRVLKRTHWFLMQSPMQDLIPQKEEDIELAIWMNLETFASEDRKIYGSIAELLNNWEAKNKSEK